LGTFDWSFNEELIAAAAEEAAVAAEALLARINER
jgi:hypothetical protein